MSVRKTSWAARASLSAVFFCLQLTSDAAEQKGEMKQMITSLRPELPNLRYPISMIVDDGLMRIAKSESEGGVPRSFVEEIGAWYARNGVKGKFSIIPCVPGQGNIVEGFKDNISKEDLDAWLRIIKDKIAPLNDIHCEIATHGKALDIKTGKPLSPPIDEWAYTTKLNKEDLAAYLAFALAMLKKAGFTANGVTQPCWYKGDVANVYTPAVLAALKKVHPGTKFAHYFLDVDGKSAKVLPRIMFLDKANKEAVVSIVAACDESMYPYPETLSGKNYGSVSAMADYFITADGAKGRFRDLMKTGSYLIWYTHWGSWTWVYPDGTHRGWLATQEVVRRVNQNLADQVKWMKTSETDIYFVATQTFEPEVKQSARKAAIVFTPLFDCRDFTMGFDLHPKAGRISIRSGVKSFKAAASRKSFGEWTWFREGDRVFVCLPLQAGTRTEINVDIL